MNELNNEYQTPEVIELGEAADLTLGRFFGTWPDGLDGLWTWQK